MTRYNINHTRSEWGLLTVMYAQQWTGSLVQAVAWCLLAKSHLHFGKKYPVVKWLINATGKYYISWSHRNKHLWFFNQDRKHSFKKMHSNMSCTKWGWFHSGHKRTSITAYLVLMGQLYCVYFKYFRKKYYVYQVTELFGWQVCY